MKTELYKTVYVRSESDLPKEEKEYIVHDNRYGIGYFPLDFNDKKCDKKAWIKKINWYLLPVTNELLKQEPCEQKELYKCFESHEICNKKPCSRLKQEPEKANFMQTRDLTDEEWLRLPKEEILQLYKNCYKMLIDIYTSKHSPFSYEEKQSFEKPEMKSSKRNRFEITESEDEK
jgi:hypothetical protein